MGHDIFAFPERAVDDGYEVIPDLKIFGWRNYDLFAFLGGHRNESNVPVLAAERGMPENSSWHGFLTEDGGFCDVLGMSWLSVRELLDYDYDATFTGTFRFVDERDGSLGYLHDPEAATEITVRRFLGPDFFDDVDRLAASGADRIVFFFA